MGIVTWILAGFAIAFLARRIMPGFAQGDLVITDTAGGAKPALPAGGMPMRRML